MAVGDFFMAGDFALGFAVFGFVALGFAVFGFVALDFAAVGFVGFGFVAAFLAAAIVSPARATAGSADLLELGRRRD
ncbi:hypothetical protein [Brevibacterium sp. FME17]|uniref:hypothetical protein n=1 Tax=Brevibacterium sp. FME17 TaxID=2742606 RepID=UPI0018694860|nr:hypothetical protein [Brevibacterium sp. FME17]